MKVPATDERNVLRDPQALIQREIHCTHRERIIETEHSIRARIKTQKSAHGIGAALPCFYVAFGFGNDVVIRDSQTGFAEGPLVAVQTTQARAGFRAANVRDFPASHVDQVLGGEHAHSFIIDAYEVCGQTGQCTVDQNIRRVVLLDSDEEFNRRMTGGDDQRVQPARQQLVDLLFLKDHIFVGRRHDQAVAALSEDIGKGFGNFREKRVEEVWNDQANEMGSSCDEAACSQVRAVVELFYAGQDSFARLIAHIGVVAQDLRNRNDRYTQVTRDILHPDRHKKSRNGRSLS